MIRGLTCWVIGHQWRAATEYETLRFGAHFICNRCDATADKLDMVTFYRRRIVGSWVTTTIGIITLVVAIGSAIIAVLDGNDATNIDTAEIIGALTGLGLIKARDDKVTSESAGAK